MYMYRRTIATDGSLRAPNPTALYNSTARWRALPATERVSCFLCPGVVERAAAAS
jgi:hypothetical protein